MARGFVMQCQCDLQFISGWPNSTEPKAKCQLQLYHNYTDQWETERTKRERERRRAKGRRISNRKLSTRAFPNCCQHSVTNFLNINRLLSVLVTVAAPAAAAEGSSGSCHSSSRMCKIKQKLIHNNSRSTADPVINYSLRCAAQLGCIISWRMRRIPEVVTLGVCL